MLANWPLVARSGGLLLGIGLVCHKTVTYFVFYPFFRLLFGTLYPAYASYKAVRTKNVKEYVKWMMYWIVFALFTCVETFTDVFLSWFPFYYEIKIVIVIWLLSPATKGSSILYRKFVHPTLSSREQEIDDYINKAKEQSYRQVLDIGSKGVSALMQTAIKSMTQLPVALALLNQEQFGREAPPAAAPKDRTDAPAMEIELSSDDEPDGLAPEESKAQKEAKGRGRRRKEEAKSSAQTRKSSRKIKGGGGLVNQLRKSYSLGDLTDGAELDAAPAPARRRRSPARSASTVAVCFAAPEERRDVSSSGCSSGEGLSMRGGQRAGSLTRSKSTRTTRSNVPGKLAAGDDSDERDSRTTLDSSSSEETEFHDAVADAFAATAQVQNARGGRYNKRRAPSPPPVRATLVLRPGRLRTLEAARKEVFVSAPAPRRRPAGRASSDGDLSRPAPAARGRLIALRRGGRSD